MKFLTPLVLGSVLAASAASASPCPTCKTVSRVANDDGPSISSWVSIETPVNPFDQSTTGALLLVHSFWRGSPSDLPISGRAEGTVNGERRSVAITFEKTSRDGVYAVRRTWPETGRWVLVITVGQGRGVPATALVQVGENGEIASVRVPVGHYQGQVVPAGVGPDAVEAMLK